MNKPSKRWSKQEKVKIQGEAEQEGVISACVNRQLALFPFTRRTADIKLLPQHCQEGFLQEKPSTYQ